MNDLIVKIADEFDFEGRLLNVCPVNVGLINDSYILEFSKNNSIIRYMLQKINSFVFRNPIEVMSNIVAVTNYLIEKDKQCTIDHNFSPYIYPITTKNGEYVFKSEENEYFRAYNFIENTYSIDSVTCEDNAFNAGRAFGKFIYDLDEFNTESLFVTIPDFHNTKKRYENLQKAINDDIVNRVALARNEIELIEESKEDVFIITDYLEKGIIPLRVTHNDTKINNVLFDSTTDKVCCVVDLDTIMPGSFLHDFGDAITTGAVIEQNDRIILDLNYYKSYVKGYFSSCFSILTKEEIELMPLAAKTISFELATRFLCDYLNGDVYFKTEYDEHNLVRTKQQLTLVLDIIKKLDEMKNITLDLAKEFSNE